MQTTIKSNELIDDKRVSTIEVTSGYIDDLLELSKAINNYISAHTALTNMPDDNPSRKMFEDSFNKAKAELDLRFEYIKVYVV